MTWRHLPLVFVLGACSKAEHARATAPPDAAADPLPAPAGPCAPGTARMLGASACTAVGAAGECLGGFTRDASGWGCEPVLPKSHCSGATYAKLGSTICAPVGDCNEAFPPADATLFVDPNAAEDATHKKTIGAAISAASAGAVIAVAAGNYTESLTVARDLTLVGRCAAQVVVASDGGSGSGVLATGGNATVRGMTFQGHRGGVTVTTGALTLDRTRFEGNREIGLVALGAKAKLIVKDSVVRGTLPTDARQLGRGIDAEGGATVELDGASIEENAEVGVYFETGSLTLNGTVVRNTSLDGAGEGGRGLYAKRGAVVTVKGSAIVHNHDVGVYLADKGTSVTIEDSAIVDTQVRGDKQFGRGVDAVSNADVTIRRSFVGRNVDSGVGLEGGKLALEDTSIAHVQSTPAGLYGFGVISKSGTVTATRSAIVDGAGLALAVIGGSATFDRSAVLGTRADGAGALGIALTAGEGAVVTFTGGVLEDARMAGAMALSDGTSLTLGHTLVASVAVEPKSTGYGHGVVAINGARADLDQCVIERATSVGLFYAGGTGVVTGSIVRGNAVGVQAQDGTSLISPFPAGADPNPLDLLVSGDTAFVDNTSRVGAGALPVPDLAKAFER